MIKLFEEADTRYRLTMVDSVEVKIACISRSMYRAALSDKNRHIGREGQANAYMEWHECSTGSLRFPPLDLPSH